MEVYVEAKDTDLGKQAIAMRKKGEAVPDEIAVPLVAARLKQPDCLNKGFVLDGFPRTAKQVEIYGSVCGGTLTLAFLGR